MRPRWEARSGLAGKSANEAVDEAVIVVNWRLKKAFRLSRSGGEASAQATH
jgi:hypothetical protein